jgi:hypothetical protein
MKSQDLLVRTLLSELGEICGTRTVEDWKYILDRRRKEGDSFYTITLPTYAKGLERCLELGTFDSNQFPGFQLGKGGLPRFLSGFLRQMFDASGSILPPTPEFLNALWAVRQLCYLLYKAEADCTPKRIEAAMQQYKETDASIHPLPLFTTERMSQICFKYFGEYLLEVERRLYFDSFKGRHGPGAVQDKTSSNGKYLSNTWTDRLQGVFPADEALASNVRDFTNQEFVWLSEEQEPPVRVITVPKTMKSPRIIAIEPIWQQYVQQGILAVMTDVLSTHHGRRVNDVLGWVDQEPNRLLAKDLAYATIDLSEASDRVPLQLVEAMLRPYPFLLDAVLASRSARAELPSGEVVTLRKFASMGSALCFPIEALVFATAAIWSIEEALELPFNLFSQNGGRVRVFGDDIIVPKTVVPFLSAILEALCFKVNTSKSFWNGLFRESCGAEWYCGHDVSVVKVRSTDMPDKQHGVAVLRWIDLHNRLFERGLFSSAKEVETLLRKRGLAYFAPVGSRIPALYTYDLSRIRYRMHPALQRVEVRCLVAIPKFGLDPLDSYGALRKYFLGQDEKQKTSFYRRDPFFSLPAAADHLERAGRPLHVKIHVGWRGLV